MTELIQFAKIFIRIWESRVLSRIIMIERFDLQQLKILKTLNLLEKNIKGTKITHS